MNKQSSSLEEPISELHRLQQRVAELEAAEEVRQESEERYRIINQTVSDYAFSLHLQADGTFVLDWLTESFTMLTGYPVSDLLGRPNPFHTYVHPDDLDQVLQTLAAMPPDAPATYEFRLLTKAGDVRWLQSSTRTVADATGQMTGFYGATQDITERKEAEAERQKVEATLQAAVEGTVHTGAAFFQWLVHYLSSTLDIQYAFVGELVGEAQDHIRTLAYWAHGDLGDNFQYAFAGSACETVIGQQLRHYPRAVAARFPYDDKLKTLQVACYLGTPLFSAIGKPLGLIAVMDTKPEGTTPLEESALLRILAGRAGTEIERQQAEEALQESEEQYRNLVESTHDLIQSVAPDGRFLFVNQAWSNTLGYTEADLARRTLFDIIHSDSQAHCQAMFARVIAGESLTNLAATFVTKDGRAIPVEGNVAARYSGGILVATHGFFRDITERKQAEKALHTRERQQAIVAELGQRALAGEDLTALMDQAVAEVAQTLDAAYCKVIELLPEGKAFVLRSGVGWHDGLVGTGIVGAELDSQAGYTLVSSEPVIVEDLGTETRFHGPPLLHAHGVVSGISVIIAGQPHPFGVLGVHTTARRTFNQDDVHFLQAVANVLAEAIERKQAEEQVRRNEAWQRSLLQATQDAFISINRQGHIARFNPAAERIFGYTQAEVQGQKVNLLMPELYAQDHDSYIERFERTGEPHAIGRIRTVSAKRKNGAVFPIELSVTEVTADEMTEYGAFIRDISEKVQLQEQMIERERLAAIGTTAATLAHEIGNPLNGMSLNMQLIQRRLAKTGEGLDARFVGYVGNMQHEITRLTNLLHEFRSVSRRQTFSFQPLNLVAVIQELLAVETPHYTERGVQVEHVMPDDLPQVQADPYKLKQVCLNLCKNAVEAMPAGGRLTLRAHAAEEHVYLEVIDTGDGIPDGVNIFEPFATTKAEGTGLGLPIVQQIITGHGGTLSYTSTPGQGTTFTVILPLSPPRATP